MRSSSVTTQLLDAVCARDFDAAADCLSVDVQLRAVLPPRFLEAAGPDDVVGWFRTWFADATTFAVIDRSVGVVAGRDRITWRFEVAPHPGTGDLASHVIEQTMFCDVRGGRIGRLDLLCSGFRSA